MNKVTIFLCTGKDCARAWKRVCDGSPCKWLKRQVQEAGLPYKLRVIRTECMDRCEDAANLCCVYRERAALHGRIHSPADADQVLAGIRSCVESAVTRAATRGEEPPAGDAAARS